MTDTLQRLVDKASIQDTMLRYARGVDRRNWELVRTAFHEDAMDHHGDFKGTRDEFITWVSASHASVAKSTHFLGNCLVEFASDDVAAVETYFVAVLRLGTEAESHRQMLVDSGTSEKLQDLRVEVIGRYVDRFERREGAWRIARRRIVFDTIHTQAATGNVDADSGWAIGRRDLGDPVFVNRSECGLPIPF